jgi:hypothetical protein
MSFQLRGCDENGVDTGVIQEIDSLEVAFEMFLSGGWWKLSWKRPNGERVRLLKDGDTIQITNLAQMVRYELQFTCDDESMAGRN